MGVGDIVALGLILFLLGGAFLFVGFVITFFGD